MEAGKINTVGAKRLHCPDVCSSRVSKSSTFLSRASRSDAGVKAVMCSLTVHLLTEDLHKDGFMALGLLTSKSPMRAWCRHPRKRLERTHGLEIDRGDPVSTEAQKHRLGLCSTIKKSKFLQSAKQELINTNFKQLEPTKINNFFKDIYCSKIWNYVKLIKEVLLKWKSLGSSRVLHSTLLQEENSSRIRTLYWNFLDGYRNCKMK